MADGSWHEYGYNERGEVNESKRLWPASTSLTVQPSTPVILGGTIYHFGYDLIGNRRTERKQEVTPSGAYFLYAPTWSATYNQQNQPSLIAASRGVLLQGQTSDPSNVDVSYSFGDNPGANHTAYVQRSGKLFTSSIYVPGRIVTVPGPIITFTMPWATWSMQSPSRTISYPRWLQFSIAQGSQSQSGNIYMPPHWLPPFSSVLLPGVHSGTQPLWEVVEGHLMIRGASDPPYYDDDGNLTHTSRWDYAWDDEDRLLYMQTTPVAAEAGVPAVYPSIGVP